ncbi:tRNA lysidine(34) synthetase TilS [Halofilum ochraceum]|uniref:tRNA lysidine(34) synthetase TilS n=1 Tax=Halofilum ochraceum TaxID=1611323 RepID=UPI001586541E|nr:tRNA lysidine(34) synthetase TilS [Halofilum ochraceum]
MTQRATDPPDPAERLNAVLTEHAPQRTGVAVAFSGGPDSTLLLHLAAENLPRRRVRALHIHHGWHADADAWADHCQQVARGLGLRCDSVRVDAGATRGEGPEAAAREARYTALGERLRPGEVLLTAHHRDDQAETLLLALLRGGGVHGWAGMPVRRTLGPGLHLRPWLDIPRDCLQAELQRRDIEALDDPANADTDYDRVWLRERVLPVLRERHGEIDATLARAAVQAGEAAAGVDSLAAHDFVTCRGTHTSTLDCAALATLPDFRQRALLRWWVHREGLPRPGAARLESLRRQLVGAAADRNPHVAWPGGEVRRWRGDAWALAPAPTLDPDAVYDWTDRRQPLELPHRRIPSEALEALTCPIDASSHVQIRFRQGGERLPRRDGEGSIALKRWLADNGVPPWERDRIPLVYVDGHLIGAIGVPRP